MYSEETELEKIKKRLAELEGKTRGRGRGRGRGNYQNRIVYCYNCGKPGHTANICRSRYNLKRGGWNKPFL